MTGDEALRRVFHPDVVKHLKGIAKANSPKTARKPAKSSIPSTQRDTE